MSCWLVGNNRWSAGHDGRKKARETAEAGCRLIVGVQVAKSRIACSVLVR